MDEFEAAFFYGDFSVLQPWIREILSEIEDNPEVPEEI
jgi:hypothetical protein